MNGIDRTETAHAWGDTKGQWPSLELVVARYHEDLQWLRRVPRRFRVTVYNKGNPLSRPLARAGVQVIDLPNHGREAYAYFYHLCARYTSLSDITVFAQGKPFDHVPDFHRLLHALAYRKRTVTDFLWLGFIIDEDDPQGERLFRTWRDNPKGDHLPLVELWQRLWREPAPATVTFFPGAHFAVTATQVHMRPRFFYQRALCLSRKLPHAAHAFERVWDRVFGVNGIPPDYGDAPKPIYLRSIRRLQGSVTDGE